MSPAEAEAIASMWRYRVEEVEKAVAKKADKTEIEAVVNELASIRKLLAMVLMAIVAASIGFGFAALQIAGTHVP